MYSGSLCAGPHKTTVALPRPTDPRPDPNPNPNPNPNPTLWGARGLFSRSAGAVLSLRANLKTLHVRANKRLVRDDVVEACTVLTFVWPREIPGFLQDQNNCNQPSRLDLRYPRKQHTKV